MTDTPKGEAGGGPRVAGVIVSHGQVANELLAAAETIIGPVKHITAVSIGWHDDVEAAKNEIRRAAGVARWRWPPSPSGAGRRCSRCRW